MTYGLGRLRSPDARDARFPLTDVVSASTRTTRFWWGYSVHLDQGATPECVAYAWSHFITDSPKPHAQPLVSPDLLYHQAQALDEWPGTNYQGTSVRGGAKALVHLSEILTTYRWAFDLQTVVDAVLELGPVIVGTNWYEEMFDPTPQSDGSFMLHVGGDVAGGHAWKIDGVNVPKRFFRMKQSWGKGWANNGFARIGFDDFDRLLAEQGEACMATES